LYSLDEFYANLSTSAHLKFREHAVFHAGSVTYSTLPHTSV